MNTDDKTIKITELIINALDYAQTHKLDLNNIDDLKKILEAIDPKHTSDINIEEFTKLIQNADTFIDTTAYRIERKKSDLPN